MLLGDSFIRQNPFMRVLMLQAKSFPTPGSTRKLRSLDQIQDLYFFLIIVTIQRPEFFPVIVMMRGWSTGTKAVSGKQSIPVLTHMYRNNQQAAGQPSG